MQVKTFFFFFLFCTLVVTACSQRDTTKGFIPDVTLHNIPVGQSKVWLRQTTFTTKAPYLLLQLHSNETTAANAAKEVAHQCGVDFIQIINNGSRLITFFVKGKYYQFDPNRIFSDEGITKTLQQSSRFSEAAFKEVQRFRDSLLLYLHHDKTIVAVHNNTDGRFNILQYKELDNANVHLNAAHDNDDFFITNDTELFLLLKKENYNVVLEDASRMKEDGSLSLYCGRKGIRYINVETEHGHLQEQITMLKTVERMLNQKK